MKCMSWSSRSASTRTVVEPFFGFAFSFVSALATGTVAPSASTGAVSGTSATSGAALTAGVALASGPCGLWTSSVTLSTSGTSRAVAATTSSSCSVASQTSTARSLKPSIADSSGLEATTSPWSATAASSMNARMLGIAVSAASCAVMWTTRWSPVCSKISSDVCSGAGAAAAASSSERTSACRRSTSGAGSMFSSPFVSIESTADSIASSDASRTSTASRERPPLRCLSSSKTSSIACVSSAMPAKPIVALMPFIE